MNEESSLSFWQRRFFIWKAQKVNIYVACECCGCCCCKEKTTAIWTFSYGGMVVKGENIMAELREGQQVSASVAFKTKAGNPALHQTGSVHWASLDPSIASVEADAADELKALIKGVNGSNNGSTTIECRADGDPDSDSERLLVATATVTVTQGEAVVSEISLGTPEDIPEVNPAPEPEPEPTPEPLPEEPPV